MSAGRGPVTSIPSARKISQAGAMTSWSSRPSAPSSPAWGLSPVSASFGLSIFSRSRRSLATMRPVSTSSSGVKSPGTSRSGTWMVTGTTRKSSLASIITGRGVTPSLVQRLGQKFGMAGKGKPGSVERRLVDRRRHHRPARPPSVSRTAWAMASIVTCAVAPSISPGRSATGPPDLNHASASSKLVSAAIAIVHGEQHVEAQSGRARTQEVEIAVNHEGRQGERFTLRIEAEDEVGPDPGRFAHADRQWCVRCPRHPTAGR